MTSEEKAEEILQTKGSMTFCAKGCEYTEKVKELIAIGLSEGRKEITYMTADEYDKTLDKCKECYLAMVEKFSKRNEDLEKTVEELQLNLRSRNDLVEELTMQIEKMKCCGNCKNKKSKPTCFFCVKLKKWELAE